MKRILTIGFFLLFISLCGYSQMRIDMGISVPLTIGGVSSDSIEINNDMATFLTTHILPFPEVSLYYQYEVGIFKMAGGIRIFTFVLESIMWPNLLLELDFQPFFLDVQVGGGAFALFGLFNYSNYLSAFIPDISGWLSINKAGTFKIGAGVLGISIPELTTEIMLFVPYCGIKFTM